jgi:hypothetical protein
MLHYHGLPISPTTAAVKAVEAGHAFVSFLHADQLSTAIDVCQSFAIDNGAFSAWRSGSPIVDWRPFYEWAAQCRRLPSCDFSVIPDVIDGAEADNDALLSEWPLPKWFGAPVWHMHESFARLERLAADWPRVCLGSSGAYSAVGTLNWWKRIDGAMRVVCDADGFPLVKLHGLRMLNPKVFTQLPLSSADSTNIGRNVGIDKKWKGTYTPPTKEMRAAVLRARIEAHNSPLAYTFRKTDVFGDFI